MISDRSTLPPMSPGDVYVYAHGSGAIAVTHGAGAEESIVTLAMAKTVAQTTAAAGGVVWIAGDEAPLAADSLAALRALGIRLEQYQPISPPQIDEDGSGLLLSAVADGRPDLLTDLIDRSSDIHHDDDLGFTALHYAAAAGDQGAVDALVATGANVNATSWTGDRPRDQALLWGHNEIAAHLVSLGAASEANSGPYAASAPPPDTGSDDVVEQKFSSWHRFHPVTALMLTLLAALGVALISVTDWDIVILSVLGLVIIGLTVASPWPIRVFGAPLRVNGMVLELRKPWLRITSIDLAKVDRASVFVHGSGGMPSRYLYLAHPDGVVPTPIRRRLGLHRQDEEWLTQHMERVVVVRLVGLGGLEVVKTVGQLLIGARITTSAPIRRTIRDQGGKETVD